jgi:hypothetical protein
LPDFLQIRWIRRDRHCGGHLGETGPLSQEVQAGRKALRILRMNGMEVREKRPRGSSEPPEPPSLFLPGGHWLGTVRPEYPQQGDEAAHHQERQRADLAIGGRVI